MSRIYVLSAINSKNIVNTQFGEQLVIRFCGVYQGESFKDILLQTSGGLELSKDKVPCILEIIISRLEKNRITGRLVSIKFLEEYQ